MAITPQTKLADACASFYILYSGKTGLSQKQIDKLNKAALEYAEEELKVRASMKRVMSKGIRTAKKRGIYVLLALCGMLFTSCDWLTEAVMPVDHPVIVPVDTIPNDSIILPPPDTCAEYIPVNTPVFITGVIQFDIIPFTDTWCYGNQFNCFPTLDSLLSWLGNPFTIYPSGINVAVIVESSLLDQYQFKIYAADGGGAFNHMSFAYMHFNFLGALTYTQAYNELVTHPSARFFGFWNTAWTCDEYMSFIQFLKDNCISGTGKIFDTRFLPCTITPELMEYLLDADFEIWD